MALVTMQRLDVGIRSRLALLMRSNRSLLTTHGPHER